MSVPRRRELNSSQQLKAQFAVSVLKDSELPAQDMAALVLTTLAFAAGRTRMEPQVVPGISSTWVDAGRASGFVSLQIIYSKTRAQVQALEAALVSVSSPEDDAYGEHLTREQVNALIAPTAASQAIVSSWLQAEGVAAVPILGDVTSLRLPVAQAEALLHTELHSYRHHERADLAHIVRASTPYSLPADVANVVSMVAELLRFPAIQAPIVGESEPSPTVEESAAAALEEKVAPTTGASWPNDCGKCDDGVFGKRVTPAVLSAAYGIPMQSANSTANATVMAAGSLAVAEFQHVYWDQSDLDGYSQVCSLPGPINFTQIGPNKPNQCKIPIIITGANLCLEALLDLETIKGIDTSLPLTDLYADAYSILDWANRVHAMEVPKLIEPPPHCP